jgi:hypothetical protein
MAAHWASREARLDQCHDVVGRTVTLERSEKRRPLNLREVAQLLDKGLELLCLHTTPPLANHQRQDRSTSCQNRATKATHVFQRSWCKRSMVHDKADAQISA